MRSSDIPPRSPVRSSLRRAAAALPFVVALLGAGGCGDAQDDGGFRVALVTPGPISDDGWNAIAFEGLERVRDELGATVQQVQAGGPSSFEGVFRDFAASGYDLVIGHGFEFSDTARAVAEDFPEVAFLVTSGAVEAPNVTSIEFAIDEPAFLAGFLAAQLAGGGTIGVVGGVEIPPVKSAFDAFARGAQLGDADAKVSVTWVGSWEDVAAARQQALALLDQGAKILFHNADAAGLGVLHAAEERGVLAIGCNKDQASVKPETVMASVVLDVPEAFRRVAAEVQRGEHRGSIRRFDLKSGVVRLALNPALERFVSTSTRESIAALERTRFLSK